MPQNNRWSGIYIAGRDPCYTTADQQQPSSLSNCADPYREAELDSWESFKGWQYYYRLTTPSKIPGLFSTLNGTSQPDGCGGNGVYI